MVRKKKDAQGVAVKKDTRWLQVELSEKELLARGQSLSQLHREIEEVEREKSEVTKKFGEDLKKLRGECAKLALTVREKKEGRDVQVSIETNYASGRVTVTRLDTGEEIEDRELHTGERQTEIKLFEDDQDE